MQVSLNKTSTSQFFRNFLDQIDRPGWKTFLSSLLALSTAFLLAVYSSIFAQEGIVIATGICASLALLLAGYVAFTALPYLARRTQLEWFRIRIDYKLTREGMYFIGFIFILAVAGLNTGNNLLYLILSSLLAAILVSGVLSMAVLTRVELDVQLPAHVFARQSAKAQIRLRNRKKILPSFSLLLSGNSQVDAPKTKKSKWRKIMKSAESANEDSMLKSRPNILQSPLYFPFLRHGDTVSREVELRFPRRGLYREDGFSISTRFPFGFLEKTLHLPVSHDLWVYPTVEPTDEFYEILPTISGELESYQRGRGHDLYSIRDMLPSDNARYIDWKTSARTGTWKVREFTREDERRIQLILDTRIGSPTPQSLERFETAVEFCSALAWHFYEINAQMQLICGEYRTEMSSGEDLIYEILRHLAEVQASWEQPSAPPAEWTEEKGFQIICTGAPQGSIPTAVWNRAYLVFFDMLRSRETGLPELANTPVKITY